RRVVLQEGWHRLSRRGRWPLLLGAAHRFGREARGPSIGGDRRDLGPQQANRIAPTWARKGPPHHEPRAYASLPPRARAMVAVAARTVGHEGRSRDCDSGRADPT